ncbi:Uncharacterised protein [Starkeya nomas]|uniref:AB hydrolase-1 domain-containing protein n=1 Tax=Starkeya nomas TaxID=2666134 RepID=A0A5S9NQT6_9HYPH|nr:Uncharacterised protein [Starkeya nomas]
MWQTLPADARIDVDVDGHKVVAYSYGTSNEVVFLLNGGPGLPCDYLRDAHFFLSEHGYRVVAFDQLGCGASDRPDDVSFWEIGRCVETVRRVLDLSEEPAAYDAALLGFLARHAGAATSDGPVTAVSGAVP